MKASLAGLAAAGLGLQQRSYVLNAPQSDHTLAQRQSQENCSSLELVIARGTDEPMVPSFGIIVGDPLFIATRLQVDSLMDTSGYAVNYPASVACNSVDLGVNDTLSHLASQSKQCPQQKFALVGYSQGATVMHQAATQIDPSLYNSITALVMFGDPGNRGPNQPSPVTGQPTPPFPAELAGKLRENCAFNDPVCTNNGTDSTAHLSYSALGQTYIDDSASYIQQQYQTDGQAGQQSSPNSAPGTSTPQNQQALQNMGNLLSGAGGILGGGSASASVSCPAPSASATGAGSRASGTLSGTASGTVVRGSATPRTGSSGANRLRPFFL